MATRPTPATWRRLGAVGLMVAAALGLAVTTVAAQEPDGEAVFQANCASCHQADGGGLAGLFPPLRGNEHVDDAEYVRGVIRGGRQGEIVVNGETYNGVMPGFAGLSDAEVDALIAYVQGDLQEIAAPTTTIPPAPQEPVDLEFTAAAAAGERLFAGWAEFDDGGPACISCHTAGSFGALYGPAMGPDLGNALAKAGGEAELAALLAEPHRDVMAALYRDDPLTPEERAQLAAYLVSEQGATAQGSISDGLAVMALGGLVLLVGYAFVFGFRGSRGSGRSGEATS